jgi:hypothetical protein
MPVEFCPIRLLGASACPRRCVEGGTNETTHSVYRDNAIKQPAATSIRGPRYHSATYAITVYLRVRSHPHCSSICGEGKPWRGQIFGINADWYSLAEKGAICLIAGHFVRAAMNRRRYHLLDFATEVNAAVVGDFAKLIVHRLVARRMRRDSSLVERAKKVQARMAEQYGGWPFVADWNELLAMPPAALRDKLVSRDREMVRLRNTSPFYLTEGIDFGDYGYRIRIARAARRVAQRSIRVEARRRVTVG